jgi:hypothetical protein
MQKKSLPLDKERRYEKIRTSPLVRDVYLSTTTKIRCGGGMRWNGGGMIAGTDRWTNIFE